ncbi:MAG: hypothetical protein IPJ39_21200 [Saprospiraceae bacterium]|nr:hypothetical protein [Saprospiraceae bacterium]
MLEYNENTVNFEYSGISYKVMEKYATNTDCCLQCLNGFKHIMITLHLITLNLKKYTFEVRAIDAIGNVSKLPAQVNFEVKSITQKSYGLEWSLYLQHF